MRWDPRMAMAAAVFALGCRPGDAFTCYEDSECSGGVCQSNGFCSFPSDSCPSGQRYGEHAAGGLAGECVEPSTTGVATMSSAEVTSSASTDSGNPDLDTSSGAPGTTTTGIATTEDPGESSSTGESVDPDLLLWFRFEDLPSTSTVDSASGYSATCEASNCPTSTPGPFGDAALFDGLNDALRLPFEPAFALDDALTVAAWIRADMLDGSMRRMLFGHPYGTGFDNSWLLYFRLEGDWAVGFAMNSASTTMLSTPVTFELGQWVHLAGTYDGVNMRLYLDGQPAGSQITQSPLYDEQHPITIGHDINAGLPAGHFLGAIDEVRMYSRVLDEGEIAALARR